MSSKCCGCRPISFLKTREGMVKMAEVSLGVACEGLLVEYGFINALTLGPAFYNFLSITASCVFTSSILLVCYMFSSKTYHSVRSSMFEIFFNGLSAFLYFSASFHLAFVTNTYALPLHILTSVFSFLSTYYGISLTYGIGMVLGLVHSYDCYMAFMYK